MHNPPVPENRYLQPNWNTDARANASLPPAPPLAGYISDDPLLRTSSARERIRRRRGRSRRGNLGWAWVVVLTAMLSVVIVSGLTLTLIVQSNDRVIDGPVGSALLPTPLDVRRDFSGVSFQAGERVTLDDGRSIVLQPWNGGSRLTVLVMGLDRRPGEPGLAYRTDSMMLISYDRDSNSLGILSIPRDLYVEVPGYSELQRINSAMVLGELQEPNYGSTLAMQTVQYNLGMYVHNYVALDFNAVIAIIDILGGIDIDVPYAIRDYQYPDMGYGYDPLILDPGLQHMDGATALKFARTRHGDNDFERGRRQQMVLFALRDRVLNFDLLPQLIIQSPSLVNALNDNLYTGLTIDQIVQLGLSLRDIPVENIRTGVIDASYSQPYTTPQGAQVLIPRRSQLGALLTEVFGEDYAQ